MKLDIPAGTYIVAVSGGVDSVVLLHLLAGTTRQGSSNRYIVAHFNHGIRDDSTLDELLAIKYAKLYGFKYQIGHAKLGVNASEDTARRARYDFFSMLADEYKASKIITAHHRGDLLETAVINLLRGTKHKGLSALASNNAVLRPMLGYTKQDIIAYAQNHKLEWREDSTNSDIRYLRNYIRHILVPRIEEKNQKKLLATIDKSVRLNSEIDEQIATISQSIINLNMINRQKFTQLPYEIGAEVIAYWLRSIGLFQMDEKLVNRLNMVIRTAKAGTSASINRNMKLHLSPEEAIIINTD